jgi:hypothetical protein
MKMLKFALVAAAYCGLTMVSAEAAGPPQIKVLFLGDKGHHKPADRFKQLKPELEARGVALTYTEDLNDLSAPKLAPYAALIIYANQTAISPEQEKALREFSALSQRVSFDAVPHNCFH